MADYEISLMTAEDVDGMHAIEEAAFATPWSRKSIEAELTNSCARYLVARTGGEVVGYAGMWLVIDEAHITNVAVRADMRGQGLGRQLMGRLIQLAADSGMIWMTLEVRRSNKAAQNLYRSFGFIDVGYRKRYYEDNQEDALLMALEQLPEGHPENDPFAVEE